VSLSKGIEMNTFLRVSRLLAQELSERPTACLTGPAMAPEIWAGLPACLTVHGAKEARVAAGMMHGKKVRIYGGDAAAEGHDDLIGAELAGALKNVIAVAAGLCEGMELGDNAKAALIARGLSEMRRLGCAMGAQNDTFNGLAGYGDLEVTCNSRHGRNRKLGLAVARGATPAEALSGLKVAEGAWTARAVREMAHALKLDLPICEAVAAVLWDGKPVDVALNELMSRDPKNED
jgi:glycerol-3-phosphate dehydrogenase (NAD(P)+)